MDRITFMMSMENGFMWDDVYASRQIDDFATIPQSLSACTKLYGLLKFRPTQVELSSSEARRRVNFFVNSLFMDMPIAPSLRYSKEYTVITPFYSEDVLLTRVTLNKATKMALLLYST